MTAHANSQIQVGLFKWKTNEGRNEMAQWKHMKSLTCVIILAYLTGILVPYPVICIFIVIHFETVNAWCYFLQNAYM